MYLNTSLKGGKKIIIFFFKSVSQCKSSTQNEHTVTSEYTFVNIFKWWKNSTPRFSIRYYGEYSDPSE